MHYFPLYLDHLGYAGWQIGAIVGMQPLLRWTSALGAAHAADRWRVRRRLLVVAGLGGALALVPLLAVRGFVAVTAVSTAVGLLNGPIIPMLDATVMSRVFVPALREAGIGNLHWHDLRHTFASRLVMKGVDLRTVQELMGHKTIAMTLRYSHLSPAHQLEAVQRLTRKSTGTTTGTEAEAAKLGADGDAQR